MKISQRIKSITPSATLAMTARAQGMKANGIDVLSMSAGEPDFDTPDNIKKAAHTAIDKGDTKYSPVAGTMALRQAVVAMTQKVYNRVIKPNNVIVGAGGKQVLFNAAAALLDPGDEALYPSPFWVSYPDMIGCAGGKGIAIPGDESKGFLPLAADIQHCITPRTRLLILNSPSNPTGATYNRPQLEEIATLLRKHPDIFIITDDIYSELVYDDAFVSIATVAPDLAERTLIATGVSKTYAMTGWRIGYGIGPAELIGAMNGLQGASTSGASSIAQAAAVEALAGDQSTVQHMRGVFKQRRDRVVAALRKIPKLEVFSPHGAFYVFPRVKAYLGGKVASTDALCEHLLENVHLAIVPGSAFGSDEHVRLSFACSDKDIDEGVRRLAAGLAQLG